MTNEIAIIGMTGRFPDARNIDEFWENLKQGKEGITPLTEEQLNQGGISPRVYQQPNYVKAAPILKNDIAEFDAEFFGYSPREAERSDPQQRLFLELPVATQTRRLHESVSLVEWDAIPICCLICTTA
jgi:microcystin synthetase protein McyG